MGGFNVSRTPPDEIDCASLCSHSHYTTVPGRSKLRRKKKPAPLRDWFFFGAEGGVIENLHFEVQPSRRIIRTRLHLRLASMEDNRTDTTEQIALAGLETLKVITYG